MVSSLSHQAGLVKLGRWVFKDICLVPLMISVISLLNRLPCDPKQGIQGDELRKSFPEGTSKLTSENESLCRLLWPIVQRVGLELESHLL